MFDLTSTFTDPAASVDREMRETSVPPLPLYWPLLRKPEQLALVFPDPSEAEAPAPAPVRRKKAPYKKPSEHAMSIAEVARELGISHERVRQIEAVALKKCLKACK